MCSDIVPSNSVTPDNKQAKPELLNETRRRTALKREHRKILYEDRESMVLLQMKGWRKEETVLFIPHS